MFNYSSSDSECEEKIQSSNNERKPSKEVNDIKVKQIEPSEKERHQQEEKERHQQEEPQEEEAEPQESEPLEEDEFEREYRLLNESIQEEERIQIHVDSMKSSPKSNFNSFQSIDPSADTPAIHPSAADIDTPTINTPTIDTPTINTPTIGTPIDGVSSSTTQKVRNILSSQKWLEMDSLPQDLNLVHTSFSSQMQDKILNWHALRKEKGLYFNERLLNTLEFRNPKIMNKMLEFMNLDAHASNLSTLMYDPSSVASWPHYQELGIFDFLYFKLASSESQI